MNDTVANGPEPDSARPAGRRPRPGLLARIWAGRWDYMYIAPALIVMLLVIALALVRLSHLIVNAGPRQLGALVHKWCVATGEIAATPGAA